MNLISILRTYLDIIAPSIVVVILVLVTLFSNICYSYNLKEILPLMTTIITVVGILLANRVHYKMQIPKLSIRWNYFIFDREKSIRIFIEVRNKEGRKIARETKAMITIKKVSKNGKEEGLDEKDFLNFQSYNVLVPRKTPVIEDELIPWMVPETPPGVTGLNGIHLKHIANISPGQVNRAPLFDIKSSSNGDYVIIVFSEYGTEVEMIPKIIGGRKLDLQYEERRYVRCVLKKGCYKFKVKVTADETIPTKGELLIDEWSIYFKEPPQGKLDISMELSKWK